MLVGVLGPTSTSALPMAMRIAEAARRARWALPLLLRLLLRLLRLLLRLLLLLGNACPQLLLVGVEGSLRRGHEAMVGSEALGLVPRRGLLDAVVS